MTTNEMLPVLVTGGAGFIGSHLVDALIAKGHPVRVLDDLSSGLAENLAPQVELIEGDLSDVHVVRKACDGASLVFHQGALGSVRRSVEAPLVTDAVNVHGTLAVLDAAREAGVRRVIAASSSSVYGGEAPLPTSELHPPAPKSPYAVSKLAGEHYCRVYASLYGLETVVLRYFNVYGPRQRPDSPYAAVIPLFIAALAEGRGPVIEGDGLQSRDFTYVGDVVEANLRAAAAPADRCSGRLYNVAGGRAYTMLEILATIAEILGLPEPNPEFAGPRPGDIRASSADLSTIRADLGFEPSVSLEAGLRATIAALYSPEPRGQRRRIDQQP